MNFQRISFAASFVLFAFGSNAVQADNDNGNGNLSKKDADNIATKCDEAAAFVNEQHPETVLFRPKTGQGAWWCAVTDREGTLLAIRSSDTQENGCTKTQFNSDALRLSELIAIGKATSFSNNEAAVDTRGNQIANVQPRGSDFDNALAQDYTALSQAEKAQGDHRDAETYAQRAMAAAQGQSSAPDQVELRQPFLKGKYVSELSEARQRLVSALDQTGRTKAPEDAARAQSSYDCWLEQASEDLRPEDINACKQAFTDAMARAVGVNPRIDQVGPPDGADVDTNARAATLRAVWVTNLLRHTDRASGYTCGKRHFGVAHFAGGVRVYDCDSKKLIGGAGSSGDSGDADDLVTRKAIELAGFCTSPD